MKNIFKTLLILSLAVTSSCSTPKDMRLKNMQDIVLNSGFEKRLIQTDSFQIFTLNKGKGNRVKIFIEGDGQVWKSKKVLSDDPTPRNPVAMKLALREEGPVIYIARPCQYSIKLGADQNCTKNIWSFNRFSYKTLHSMNQVIDKYKAEMGFEDVELIGFSGGGTIAMLLTTLRNDIQRITTYSGNLDVYKWIRHHNITPLIKYMNPADFKEYFIDISQKHYVGTRDRINPPFLAYEFIEGLNNARVIELDTDHNSWDEIPNNDLKR